MDLRLGKIVNILSQIPDIFVFVGTSWREFWSGIGPLAAGILIQVILVLIIIFIVRCLKKRKFSLVFDLLMEEMYKFFEEILGEKTKTWIKTYVISLFFIILIVNLSIWVFDVVRVMFEDIEILEHYVHLPTADFNFTVAIAIVSILIFLFIQFRTLKPVKFFLEYLPITGNGILTIDKGNLPGIAYYPLWVVVKLADIAISMFIGILDIVGIGAKVISLSARLYGNMVAGGILLSILVLGVNGFTQNLIGENFPLIAPMILYAQGLLVAVIQAFVFPLLVAIFIKIAQTEED